jgi:hypothetical protein
MTYLADDEMKSPSTKGRAEIGAGIVAYRQPRRMRLILLNVCLTPKTAWRE